jgi:methyl-accepting chemotaxis protein
MECLEDRMQSVVISENLLAALDAFKEGDFSVRLDFGGNGLAGRVAEAFNEVADQHERLVGELERISQVVG